MREVVLCLWSAANGGGAPFWRVAYHALYYTHLYLQPDESAFRPWALHQTGIQDLDDIPAPPDLQELLELPSRPPQTGVPYTKAQLLSYLYECDAMVDAAVGGLDVLRLETGFSWHRPVRPKIEHQIEDIRHLQHHTSQLAYRVHVETGRGIDWKGSGRG